MRQRTDHPFLGVYKTAHPMHIFLLTNRDELIACFKRKVAQHPMRYATSQQLANGIPLLLDQLTKILAIEEAEEPEESLGIAEPTRGDSMTLSEIGDRQRARQGSFKPGQFGQDLSEVSAAWYQWNGAHKATHFASTHTDRRSGDKPDVGNNS